MTDEGPRLLSGIILVSAEPERPVGFCRAGPGVELLYPPEAFGESSRITALRGPDGNTVELTELGPGRLEHLRTHRAGGGDLVAHRGGRLNEPTQ